MLTQLARNWWVLALRGVAAIVFGILAFLWPGITLAVLVLLFGAYALVDGVFAVIGSIQHRHEHDRWWVLLLEGIAGIIAGVLTFAYPGITAFVLLYLIAAWAIVTGVIEIVAAIRLRKEIQGEFWLALGGIFSVLFGVLIVVFPGAGALTVVWIIAAYAILFGITFIALALRLRAHLGRMQHPAMRPAA